MTTAAEKTATFFQHYTSALLARDEAAIATMYAVPSLILFPGQSIAVTSATQTEQFFASSWSQYDGVETADPQISVIAEGPGSIWADVSWAYDGSVRERFCYQLITGEQGTQIAVLTPLELTVADRAR